MARDLLASTSPLVTGGEPAGADWPKLAQAGWLGLEVPEAPGGSGATFAEVAVVLEELGGRRPPAPFLGTVARRRRARRSSSRRPPGTSCWPASPPARCVATVAVPAGADDLDAGRLPFRLERVDGEARVAGGVPFVPDAPGADRILVVADDPPSGPVLVDVAPGGDVDGAGHAGGRRHPVASARSSPTARPSTPTGAGRSPATRTTCSSAARSPSPSTASASPAPRSTPPWPTRASASSSGEPIGSFQAVKHACADVAVELTISRRLVAEAVERLVAGAPDAGVAVAMAKAHAVETAVAATGTALQLHGGIGYTWEHGTPRAA